MIEFKGIPSVNPIRKEMLVLMNVKFEDVWDKELSFITKKIELDIVKLDDILHSRHGDYEDKDKSMSDIVREEYGVDAVNLIERLL